MNSIKTRATRIWQDDIGNEYEAPANWLWKDVLRMEGPEGLKSSDEGREINWQNKNPKTVIYLQCGACLCVLGKFDKWDERWDIYLRATERKGLLFTTNN